MISLNVTEQGLQPTVSYLRRLPLKIVRNNNKVVRRLLSEGKDVAVVTVRMKKQSDTSAPMIENHIQTRLSNYQNKTIGRIYVDRTVPLVRAIVAESGYTPHWVSLYKPGRERLRIWAKMNLGYVPRSLFVGRGVPGAGTWNKNGYGMGYMKNAFIHINKNIDKEYKNILN